MQPENLKALQTMFPGMTPDEDEINHLTKHIMAAVRKGLANQASAAHARIKDTKALDRAIREDPAARLAMKTQQRESDENTEVADSILNAFSLLSSL